jgi:hypothetical protein
MNNYSFVTYQSHSVTYSDIWLLSGEPYYHAIYARSPCQRGPVTWIIAEFK